MCSVERPASVRSQWTYREEKKEFKIEKWKWRRSVDMNWSCEGEKKKLGNWVRPVHVADLKKHNRPQSNETESLFVNNAQ